MKRALVFTFVIGVFLLLYGTLVWFVLSELAKLFGVWSSVILVVSTFFLTISFPIVTVFERKLPAGRLLYVISAIIMGLVFIAFVVLLCQRFISIFFEMPKAVWRWLVVMTTIMLTITALFCGNTIAIKKISIVSKKIRKPLRVVHISDLHIGSIRRDHYVAKVVREIQQLRPDVVVITGDLFDGPGKYDVATLKRFDTIGVPVLFSVGNHDLFLGDQTMRLLLAKTKIISLRQRNFSFGGVQFLGIDDENIAAEVAKKRDLLPKTNDFTVLLYHRPSAWQAVRNVDLQLSGHTHAGQIFPFTLLVWLFERPVMGLHRRKDGRIYVSPGTGTWGPPMRLGSRNTITVITLSEHV